ncbi:hypothetical protein A5886_001449 [Enterococcus sp. 8G7_MSG3316]|uniref:NAD(P)-binding domain-containing protein n=1 Tax=Candidatus Enterococcus testudinis TaxID=1834191 RepID=A0A242A5Z1_9ENTE|nr:NAD(P)H-binding protein [Enterococcus sp. 8G7_MSG3316]OTN76372.1 hypothetical protein A5886_001449 [Enterococcus sp. 8G7_MSG3316]
MKVFIIGASGRVGSSLCMELVKRGHPVYAGARNLSKINKSKSIIPASIDLHNPIEALVTAYGDADVVYFTVGTNGRDLLQIEAYGAVKAMQAAEKKVLNGSSF